VRRDFAVTSFVFLHDGKKEKKNKLRLFRYPEREREERVELDKVKRGARNLIWSNSSTFITRVAERRL